MSDGKLKAPSNNHGHHEDQHDRMLPFTFDLPPSALFMINSVTTLPKLKEAMKDTCLLGIDTETQPAFKKRKWNHFETHPTAIIQIATRSKRNNVEEVFIIDMLVCIVDHDFKQAVDEILLTVLRNKDVLKVGQGLERDFDELHLSYPSMKCFEMVEGIIETHDLVKQLQPEVIQMLSLKALVKTYLHHELLKTQQCSNWGKRPLTSGQIQYAACDALVLLRLYDAMLCEIEELYMDRDGDEFDIHSLAKSADLTASRPMTMSAKKRKSSFFETRENLRVQTQQQNKNGQSDGSESNDGTSADSVSEDELTKSFGKKNVPWSNRKQKKQCEKLLSSLVQRQHTRFEES